MPIIDLKTNVKVADSKAFTLEFSKLVAETMGHSEGFVSVLYTHEESLTFAGTHEPAFLLQITSVDNMTPEQNEKFSKTFAAFIKEKLGASDDRGYIIFRDPGRDNVGFKSSILTTLIGPSPQK